MKPFATFLEQKSDISSDRKDILLEMLAAFRALYWNYYGLHWTSQGNDYYGNHLLFQRLYESMPEEIDTLAEKIVGYYGKEAINSPELMRRTQKWVDKWNKEGDNIKQALQSEEDLQDFLDTAYNKLKNSGEITLGLDDFIMSVADDHETHLYLLRQASKH